MGGGGARQSHDPSANIRTLCAPPDSLTRRFTLLRSSTGEAVSIEDLRNRFAEQRARGAENQVSEEEEEMILETLGRLRAKASTTSSNASTADDSGYHAGRESLRSTNTSASAQSSLTSSPAGKRYSNNLFGSGKFRDYSYMRSATQQPPRGTSGRRALSSVSVSSTASSSRHRPGDRPSSPEDSMLSSDLSGNDRTPVMSTPRALPEGPALLENRFAKALPRDHMRRASLALEEVIREIEEEAEVDTDGDRVLMPRSPVSYSDRHSRNGEFSGEAVRALANKRLADLMFPCDVSLFPFRTTRHTTRPRRPSLATMQRGLRSPMTSIRTAIRRAPRLHRTRAPPRRPLRHDSPAIFRACRGR